MRTVLKALSILVALPPLLSAAELQRYVYMVQPDGSTGGGPGQRNGILVLDIVRKFSFVKRITTPDILQVKQHVACGGGMRGIAACARTGRLYYSWDRFAWGGGKDIEGGVGCMDLATDTRVWERRYPFKCERLQISIDGTILYVPGNGLTALDAADGQIVTRVPIDFSELNAAHSLHLGQPKDHAMVTGAGDYVWFSCGAVLAAQTGEFVCVMTAEDGKFTRGAKFLEVDFLDGQIVWAGQDEGHGFIYDNYPSDRVRPLLPGTRKPSSPMQGKDSP